ncbi:MAG: hypothetical protein R2798_13015 [Chitinophagales bacterium]
MLPILQMQSQYQVRQFLNKGGAGDSFLFAMVCVDTFRILGQIYDS